MSQGRSAAATRSGEVQAELSQRRERVAEIEARRSALVRPEEALAAAASRRDQAGPVLRAAKEGAAELQARLKALADEVGGAELDRDLLEASLAEARAQGEPGARDARCQAVAALREELASAELSLGRARTELKERLGRLRMEYR